MFPSLKSYLEQIKVIKSLIFDVQVNLAGCKDKCKHNPLVCHRINLRKEHYVNVTNLFRTIWPTTQKNIKWNIVYAIQTEMWIQQITVNKIIINWRNNNPKWW